MSHRLFLVSLFSFSVLFFEGTASAASELSERLAQAEADLKKVRESLHVAHQELGEKTEEIRQLKKALEQSPAGRQKKKTIELMGKLKRELQVAHARIHDLEKGIEVEAVATEKAEAVAKEKMKHAAAEEAAGKKARAAKAEEKKDELSRALEPFRVNYDLNSAASLEGREKALKWMQSELKKNPGARFEIRGRSNDREFKEANRAIAENRANFLASFLRVSGVPSDAIVKIAGDRSMENGAEGRIVEVIKAP